MNEVTRRRLSHYMDLLSEITKFHQKGHIFGGYGYFTIRKAVLAVT